MASNSPQDATINIPFKVRLEATADYLCYAQHDLVHASCHASASKGKAKLRAMITDQVELGLRAAEHSNRGRVIGCTDGTVLVVRWAHDGWGYNITGPGRSYAGFNGGRAGAKLDDVYADAINHAQQAYGGVVWECSL